jgi:hypothetical protein
MPNMSMITHNKELHLKVLKSRKQAATGDVEQGEDTR